MSRAKLFNMIKSRGEQPQGRNAFDLGNAHVYTQKAAKITPVKAFHTYPDDYLEVSASEFSQNIIPMNTAAFLRGKKELLAYFIPYNTIWHNFNQFQATREDPESTLLQAQGILYCPRMSLTHLYNSALYFLIGSFVFNDYLDLMAICRYYEAYKDHLPASITGESGHVIGEIYDFISTHVSSVHGVTFLQYYKDQIFSEYKEWYFDDFATSYGVDNSSYIWGVNFMCFEYGTLHDYDLRLYDTYTNMFGNFIWCDWCQKLDMLGYGNIYPILHDCLEEWRQEIENIKYVYASSIGDVDDLTFTDRLNHSYTLNGNSFKLNVTRNTPLFSTITAKYLAKLDSICTVTIEGEPCDEYVNVFSIYAYNKVFYDFMRNVYFDTDYSVYNYNCDFINGKSLFGSIIDLVHVPLRWYHLECHQWKKDMFTAVLPDNQLGQVSELILSAGSQTIYGTTSSGTYIGSTQVKDSQSGLEPSNTSFNALQIGVSHNPTPVAGNTGDGTHEIQLRSNHTHPFSIELSDTSARLNVLALKRAEAIQQYRQDLMRAGNRTQDIFKQIYGSTPKSELDEAPYFIEVASNDISVNPIIATAETGQGDNGSLGDIAARSTITGAPLNFKFSTKDFGVVLFLSYIVPDSMYNSYRLDPLNMILDQEGFGLPYFQNLGLQPVIGAALNNLASEAIRTRILGYCPPYIERKTDVDLVHGNLVDCFIPRVNAEGADTEYQGSLSHWVVSRADMQQECAVSLRNFYINPRVLDSVFKLSAGDDYETDHFLTYSNIDIKAVRAFTEIGLPRF